MLEVQDMNETPVPVAISLYDGTELPVTADAFGYLARHNGITFHLTATETGPRSVSPPKWRRP